jgi:anti-anti-sigma regulatory factor
VVDGLDFEARRLFIAEVGGEIDKARGASVQSVCLDCSQAESVDDGTLGMLVLIARQAQRRGTRITLVGASERFRARTDGADVSHFFEWPE